ncbi:MAG TPA: UPF0182 family protein [Xenococcaceae cyanobacterium]
MRLRQKVLVALILIGIIGLTLMSTLVHLLTESWWFDAVGFTEVFWTRITWQIGIWVVTFAIYGLFLWLNYGLALRFTRDRAFSFFRGSELEPHNKTISNLAASVLMFIVALSAASTSAKFWETSLKFFKATEFNSADPIYGRDIGFYLFRLPFYEGLQSWLFILLLSGLIAAAAVYLLKGLVSLDLAGQKLRLERQWQNQVQGQQKTHLTLLLAAIAVMIAVDFWLKRYDLLYSAEGVVWGAGYTDTHARLLAYWVMSIVALILGFFLIWAVWSRRNKLPFYGIVLYFVILFLVNGVAPELQQRFIVEPNELDKELPYIKHNLEFTRQAYDLAEINAKDYDVTAQLTREVLTQDQGTIQNIRLWDYRPLLSTYRQLQEIRPYYRFNDVDIDRYTIEGNYRQVMLSSRELSYERVPEPAQTWVNQRLKYTHGYGVVMSPVNLVTPDGLPVLFIKNIPPVSEIDLEVTEPAIYYGEESDRYIFTGANTPEFDYPQGDTNAFTKYEGPGGVAMPTFWHRLAYAYDLGSLKILISNYFTDQSRIHYYRQIRKRVSHIAPFLQFDRDPYIAVIDGKLQWIIDAYTTSDRFPYSEPVANQNATELIANQRINYIRNSVKVLVDAKDGTMQFFVVDDTDPVLATYRKIFPNLFISQETIPPQVRDHFRYPLDLFKIQAQMYLSYHMNDPQVFYNREDLWRFATENYEGNQQPIEPYYQIMNLPGESQEEFALILPFTPVNKDNMIAWMAARSDGENYGKLLLYEFPKQKLIYGPFQIEARIDQNPEISQQLTLWSQKGSRVIRGDLLVIPINGALLYIEPVYLRAEQGELPELRRVIVAYDKEVVMYPTLEQSLVAIFGNEKPPVAESATPVEADSNLIEQAIETFNQSESALRQGNWSEYGRYQQQLKELLQQLEPSETEP